MSSRRLPSNSTVVPVTRFSAAELLSWGTSGLAIKGVGSHYKVSLFVLASTNLLYAGAAAWLDRCDSGRSVPELQLVVAGLGCLPKR